MANHYATSFHQKLQRTPCWVGPHIQPTFQDTHEGSGPSVHPPTTKIKDTRALALQNTDQANRKIIHLLSWRQSHSHNKVRKQQYLAQFRREKEKQTIRVEGKRKKEARPLARKKAGDHSRNRRSSVFIRLQCTWSVHLTVMGWRRSSVFH